MYNLHCTISIMDNKNTLLKIVQTWNISPKPEYRGFRCANCQKYMHKAWYHWLKSGGFVGPVHFCNQCERGFNKDNIKIINPQVKIDRSKFLNYPVRVKELLIKTAGSFPVKDSPVYKIFTCDKCHKNHFKMFHVWDKQGKDLVEAHFCKKCWLRNMLK